MSLLFVSESEQWVIDNAGLPSVIDLGLDQVRRITDKMNLGQSLSVIAIGGTNGKGSVGKMVADILTAAGHRVGHYTSPHVSSFFERICINGEQAKNAQFLQSLQAVTEQSAKGEITYFEMLTLAAVHYFEAEKCDVAIMEVGLGGRLDAVNVFDSIATVITNIAMDHMEFLGNTRDKIAIEKAGICRRDKPVIIGDKKPPAALLAMVEKIGASVFCIGKDFKTTDNLSNRSWHYQGISRQLYNLNKPSIQGKHQINNAACALALLESINKQWWPGVGCIRAGFHSAFLLGRTQVLAGKPAVVLDVAHNVAAAKVLDDFLLSMGLFSITRALIGIRADKDFFGFVDTMFGRIDEWYIGDIDNGVCKQTLSKYLEQKGGRVQCFSSVKEAAKKIHEVSREDDRIVITGSFLTVAEFLQK